MIPAIQADLLISHAVAGLLATIPVLCMGGFALIGPWLGRRLGPERAIAAGVAGITVFGLMRAFAPEPISILLLTFGVGVGIAVVGPLVPIVVRARAAERAAAATGAHAGGIVLGATLGAGLAVPLALPPLDWRLPLIFFAVLSAVTLVAWLVLERPSRPAPRSAHDAPPPRLPWLRRRAWALAFIFGTQSILFYAAISWLPSIYVERGWREIDAGLLLALMNGISLVTTFALPPLAERFGARRDHLLVAAATSFAGLVGIALTAELAVLWVCLLGIGLGAMFPLALTLPVDFAQRARQVGGLAAIMLFGGYTMAAVGPFLIGVARDATGSFTLSMWLMVGVAAALLAACWTMVPAALGRREPASVAGR